MKLDKKDIICILGKSGVGKNTIAEELKKFMDLSILPSFTTRKIRQGEENGKEHLFISLSDFFDLKEGGYISVCTFFDNNYYGALLEQIHKFDIYILDKTGLENLKKNTKNFNILSIYIKANIFRRIFRMKKRGDSWKNIFLRIKNDKKMFNGLQNNVDYIIYNNTFSKCLYECMNKIYDKFNKKEKK